jgi:DNA polymerase III subunit beta
MKFSIARSEMADALTVVAKALSSRSTLPILSGVLITAADGKIELQATDLEISIKHSAAALVESEGSVVVPGKLLTDIVRSLPEAAVSIETEAEAAHVTCAQSSFTVRTLPAADFPKFPEVAIDKKMRLDGRVLSATVKQVGRAVSRDETRAIITGVLMVTEGPSLRLVATDSYRLALRERVLETAPGEDIEVVVPGRALDEVSRLAQSNEEVVIGTSHNQIVFELGPTVFVTRKIEGNFPNYRQLLPKETNTTVSVSTEELTAAVKRVALMAQHNAPIKVSVNVEDMTLALSATTQDLGDASEDLMVKAEGDSVEIAFNHSFFLDGLASADTEEVTLSIVNSLKPGLITTPQDEGFVYLLMPVRLT